LLIEAFLGTFDAEAPQQLNASRTTLLFDSDTTIHPPAFSPISKIKNSLSQTLSHQQQFLSNHQQLFCTKFLK
jgi:hypothetical protein